MKFGASGLQVAPLLFRLWQLRPCEVPLPPRGQLSGRRRAHTRTLKSQALSHPTMSPPNRFKAAQCVYFLHCRHCHTDVQRVHAGSHGNLKLPRGRVRWIHAGPFCVACSRSLKGKACPGPPKPENLLRPPSTLSLTPPPPLTTPSLKHYD